MDAEQVTRFERIADRQGILDCLTRISRGLDRFDRDLFMSAFHDDAIIAGGENVGAPALIYDWSLRTRGAQQKATFHNLLNHTCSIDGDTAHSETYYLLAARNGDETNLIAGGRYIDRLEKRKGEWRIALRNTTFEWAGMLPTIPLPFSDVPGIQDNGVPSRSKEDPSYRRPLVNRRPVNLPSASPKPDTE